MERAIEEGDTKAFRKAFEDYDKKKTDYYSKPTEQEPQQPQASQTSKNVEIFKKFNPWFDVNPEMTNFALQVNEAMKKDPNWNDPSKVSEEDFLAEISRRTNMQFSQGIGLQQQQQQSFNMGNTGGVGSNDFSPPKPGQSSDSPAPLNDTQKSIARKLFPNEDPATAYKYYAEEL